MAAAGKKGKKKQWKSVGLETILPDSHPGLVKSASSWADEVEDSEREHVSASARKPNLPTAPRSVRGSDDINVPTSPPFVAYVTNIPFEITEDELAEFFGGMQIINIRLPESEPGRLRGYGYVEFEDRNSLIEALQIPDTSLKGRRLRIELSENSDRHGRMDRGRDRMGMGRDWGDDDPDRTSGDWRSKPREQPPGDDRDRFRSGARRDFGDRDGRDFAAPRESDSREGGWREEMGSAPPPSDRDRDRDRDRDSFRSRDGFGERRGFGDSFDRDRGSRFGGDREGFDRPRFGDRDRDGPPRRFDDREEDRDRDRFSRRDDGPPSESGEPRTRPRLQLQPRTRPVEIPQPPPEEKPQPVEVEKPPVAAAPPVPRASIFGAAKPVDTAARERQIEERLAKERERPPRQEDRDRDRDRDEPAPKEGSEHEEDGSGKKVDAAPPPKENAWARRPRVEPGANNGESDRLDGSHERPSRDRGSQDGEVREDWRGGNRDRQDDEGFRENGSGRYRDDNRGGSRDRRDDNRGGSQDRREDPRGGSRDRHDDIRGPREYRDEARVGSRERRDDNREDAKAAPRDSRSGDNARSKDDGANSSKRYERGGGRGRSGHHERVDNVKGRGGSKSRQPPDRPTHRDHSNEDQPRMPKYEEKQVPNFVGSNKYAFLGESEDPDAVSD